jgi:hypothetical protein
MTKNPGDRKRYRNACKKVSILKQQETIRILSM